MKLQDALTAPSAIDIDEQMQNSVRPDPDLNEQSSRKSPGLAHRPATIGVGFPFSSDIRVGVGVKMYAHHMET